MTKIIKKVLYYPEDIDKILLLPKDLEGLKWLGVKIKNGHLTKEQVLFLRSYRFGGSTDCTLDIMADFLIPFCDEILFDRNGGILYELKKKNYSKKEVEEIIVQIVALYPDNIEFNGKYFWLWWD